MRKCPKCNRSYQEDKKFCRVCGVSLVLEKELSPEFLAKKEVLEAKIKAEPLNTKFLLEFARLICENELWEKSFLILLKLLAINENDAEALPLLFNSYKETSKFEDALKTGEKLLTLKPQEIPLLTELAAISTQIKDFSRTVYYLDQITNCDANNKQAWQEKARVLAELGKKAESLASWEQVYKLDPDNLIAKTYLGVAASKRGDFQKGIDLLQPSAEKLADNISEKTIASLYLAWVLSKIESSETKTENIINNLDTEARCISDNKNILLEIFLYLGEIKLSNGEYHTAIKFFEKAQRINKSKGDKWLATAWCVAGKEQLKNGNVKEAVKTFENVLIFDSEKKEYQDLLENTKKQIKQKSFQKKMIAASIVLLVLAGGMVWYLAHGDIFLSFKSKSDVILRKDGNIILDFENVNQIKKEFLLMGEYFLEVKAEGYEKLRKKIIIGWMSNINEMIDLVPTFGSLKVNSIPSNLDVYINGDKKGTTPIKINNLLADVSTKVELKRSGYYWSNYVRIKKDETLDIGTSRCKFDLSSLSPEQITKPDFEEATYYVDFEKNNGNWDNEDSKFVKKEIKDGKIFYGTKKDGRLSWEGETFSDFWYGATVRKVSSGYHDTFYGIVFRVEKTKNTSTWAYFAINDKGEYLVKQTVPDYPGTTSYILSKGRIRYKGSSTKVHLAVECIGNNITCFVDGIKIASAKFKSDRGTGQKGQIGICVLGAKTTVEFDNLYVKEIPYLWKIGKLAYKENFNSANKKTRKRFELDKVSIREGKAYFKAQSDKRSWNKFYNVALDDYSYQVDVSFKEGSYVECGPVFFVGNNVEYDGNQKVVNSFFMGFYIEKDKDWVLFSYSSKSSSRYRFNEIFKGYSEDIKPNDVNKLRIDNADNNLKFFINDKYIANYNLEDEGKYLKPSLGNEIGFYVDDGTAAFDNVKIYTLN